MVAVIAANSGEVHIALWAVTRQGLISRGGSSLAVRLFRGPRIQLRGMRFPMLSVERFNGDFTDRTFVQASYIDAVAVRVGTGHVKRLDAAHFAEKMFGDPGVEGIGGKEFRTSNESEAILREEQVQESAFAANRTVAFDGFDLGWCFDLESDASAVTPAAMCSHKNPATS